MTKTFQRIQAVLALALVGPAAAACGRGASDLPTLPFEKYTLANGLEVILSQDHRLPLVAVDVWYHVGPANEAVGRTGFAHLFEHMMFQGSKHVPGDSHFQLLEAAGGTNLNGTTSFDRTNYFQTLPANQLELGLWLESDRMGYLLDTVDAAKLANQQDVVRNERRQSVENRPYGLVDEAMFQTLFPPGHPYHGNVIGSHADIQAAKLDDVKAFFRQYYAPNNASLAIAGDFDPAEAKRLIEKYFGPLKRGPAVPKVTATTPPLTAERRVVVPDRVQLPRVSMGWITPPFFKPGDAEADVAANLLGGGTYSRLYKALVYDRQIAQDVTAFQYSLTLGSTFQIIATARPGHTADEVAAAIDAVLDELAATGPEPREVERANNVFETELLQGLEVLGGFGGVADTLNMFNHYLGDPGYLPKYIASHRAVTPASVWKFVQTYLKKTARAVVYGVPGEPVLAPPVPVPPPDPAAAAAGGAAVNEDAPWRREPPKPAAAHAVTLPAPASFTLPNGLTVIHHERQGMPIVAAQLVIGSGGDSNPPDRPGLANFVASVLDQGTTTRSALQLADEVGQIGAALDVSSSKDAITLAVQSLRSNFPAALDLMADVALHPAFQVPEVERQRRRLLAQFVEMRQHPGTVAQVVSLAALYGGQHPYGHFEIGTEASVQAIQAADLQRFWQPRFVPANAALVVSGTIGEADLRALVEQAFGAWTGTAPARAALPAPQPASGRVFIVDRPGSPQTQLIVATLGAPRSTPDYAAMNVMNSVLGGLFSSRINLNLREQHGYTYGASSQFLFRRHAGPFWVASGVRTDVTAPAVAEIFKEIRRMLDEPIADAELTMARDAIVRSLPADFETAASTAGSLAAIHTYGLGLDYYRKYPADVAAVTAAAAQAAARKYLVPGRLIVIAVGDRAAIEPGLRRLNLGAVEVRGDDGRRRVP